MRGSPGISITPSEVAAAAERAKLEKLIRLASQPGNVNLAKAESILEIEDQISAAVRIDSKRNRAWLNVISLLLHKTLYGVEGFQEAADLEPEERGRLMMYMMLARVGCKELPFEGLPGFDEWIEDRLLQAEAHLVGESPDQGDITIRSAEAIAVALGAVLRLRQPAGKFTRLINAIGVAFRGRGQGIIVNEPIDNGWLTALRSVIRRELVRMNGSASVAYVAGAGGSKQA